MNVSWQNASLESLEIGATPLVCHFLHLKRHSHSHLEVGSTGSVLLVHLLPRCDRWDGVGCGRQSIGSGYRRPRLWHAGRGTIRGWRGWQPTALAPWSGGDLVEEPRNRGVSTTDQREQHRDDTVSHTGLYHRGPRSPSPIRISASNRPHRGQDGHPAASSYWSILGRRAKPLCIKADLPLKRTPGQ